MIRMDEAAVPPSADGHHYLGLVIIRALVLYAIVPVVAFLLLAPFVLATFTMLLQQYTTTTRTAGKTRSALCAGRVWHTRFLPVKHAFQYPLFIFCLDLQEVETNGLFARLWPMSLLVSFEESDHLKNGEGRQLSGEEKVGEATTNNETNPALSERLYRLVAERTKGKFQPTVESHSILLITHLRYYGYNFNPVSFYILQSRGHDGDGEQISAVVGEVSNTPWNEMHCYVLHPDSVDQVKLRVDEDINGSQQATCFEENQEEEGQSPTQKLHYVFPKKFHVSPFMEMNYDYEWLFWNFSTSEPNATIRIINNLRQQDAGRLLQFTAKMLVQRHSVHPYRIAWHVSTFPVYCAIIQLWIHYEAFRLFVKGVHFQPHPAGTETAASRWIGRLMQPGFALQAWWQERSGSKKNKHE